MQHQPGMIQRGTGRIDRIAQDHMPHRQHMHPQLVRAARAGQQAHARRLALVAQHAPICLRRAACRVTDHLAGTVFPIDDQRQIHSAFARFQQPLKACLVGLFRALFLELHRQVALGMGCQGKDDHARCIPVQTMHQQGLRKNRLDPGDQAIGQIGPAPRHRQKPGGLVQNDDLVILMQDGQGICRGGISDVHALSSGASAPRVQPPAGGGGGEDRPSRTP